jgi:hypothetical protein
VCTGSTTHRGDGEFTSKKFKGFLKFPFSHKADIALNVYPCGARDRARGLHLTKGNIFVIRNDATRRSLAALLLVDEDYTILFPFGNSSGRTDNNTNWFSAVMT